eukprot:jgi/Ulvmu1/7372/UM036_0032.1
MSRVLSTVAPWALPECEAGPANTVSGFGLELHLVQSHTRQQMHTPTSKATAVLHLLIPTISTGHQSSPSATPFPCQNAASASAVHWNAAQRDAEGSQAR